MDNKNLWNASNASAKARKYKCDILRLEMRGKTPTHELHTAMWSHVDRWQVYIDLATKDVAKRVNEHMSTVDMSQFVETIAPYTMKHDSVTYYLQSQVGDSWQYATEQTTDLQITPSDKLARYIDALWLAYGFDVVHPLNDRHYTLHFREDEDRVWHRPLSLNP